MLIITRNILCVCVCVCVCHVDEDDDKDDDDSSAADVVVVVVFGCCIDDKVLGLGYGTAGLPCRNRRSTVSSDTDHRMAVLYLMNR